jgi:hypothetical protein
VELHIRDVRKRLLTAGDEAPTAAEDAAVVADLVTLFHEVVGQCFTAGSPIDVVGIVSDIEADAGPWRAAILEAIYRVVVLRSLERDRAVWKQFPAHFATFWRGVENFSDWVTGMLLEMSRKHGTLDAARDLLACERSLRVELREPGWTDTVVVTGHPEGVLLMPETNSWCVTVLHSDPASRHANLALAALYRLLLEASGEDHHDLRLVAFADAVQDRSVPASDLDDVEQRLKQAISRMAGVSREGGQEKAPAFDWKQVTPQHLKMQENLVRVLRTYGLKFSIDGQPRLGPTFIRFLVLPTAGAKVSKFTRLIEEIALGMNLRNPPIIERVGDRIAIDVERPDRRAVSFDALRTMLPQPDRLLGNSKMLVGVDIDGRLVFIDLAKPEHCHVLVVGTAGSGKSIWMRAALASLVETNVPDTLRLVLIDPKRNAFTAWRASPFLWEPIVHPDETPALDILSGLVEEMEQRYERMGKAEVDDLRGLVRHENRPIPRIVCVCDEYADLVVTSDDRHEIEATIARLGAKARAAGIHLILATQTPRREIIGGMIKANLPTCVGLRVSSETEAKIIEMPGAELLLGNGDLLLRSIGEPMRLQGPLLAAEREHAVPARART